MWCLCGLFAENYAVKFKLAVAKYVLWKCCNLCIILKTYFSAGIVVQGLLRADTSFVRSQVEFVLTTEPKLDLVSDLDFYNTNSLCMQLKQPDTTLK